MVVLRVRRSGIAWQGRKVSRKGFVALMYVPGMTLVFDEHCQSSCVGDSLLTQVRISTDPAIDIVNGLPVPGDPNLPGRKVEVQKVIHGLR